MQLPLSTSRIVLVGAALIGIAACQDITRYARFNPAWDAAGNPISGSWGTTIVYQLGR